ncbi:phage tail protein [Azospirillum halopraeferens]|uniref:phage tail protein n=1 Tax=Azospirillum halopraeferens TaxID=34010 RepID=UPI0004019A1C|nr:tail fiber protein [Azospirillum halopraeferens]
MSEVYVGEIRIFPYNKIPDGWVSCDGRLLPIQQNMALFALLNTTFGGDGKTNFGVPDLRGRAMLGMFGTNQGVSPQLGAKGGLEAVTLTTEQMPAHSHTLNGTSSNGTTANPTNAYFAPPVPPPNLTNPPANPPMYGAPQSLTALNPSAIQPQGGGQAHENRQPFLAMQYCIATLGYFPQRA